MLYIIALISLAHYHLNIIINLILNLLSLSVNVELFFTGPNSPGDEYLRENLFFAG